MTKKPQDATLRNVRAAKARVQSTRVAFGVAIASLTARIDGLASRLARLERGFGKKGGR